MKLLTLLTIFVTSALAANLSTVYQFPNGTWLENIAPTHNGSLLVSLVGVPEVHIVHPSTKTSNFVNRFPDANAVLGITALSASNDIFAVAVGTLILPNKIVPGTYSIYTISLPRHNINSAVKVEKIVDLKDGVQMVNGITLLNPTTLLLADSYGGVIFRLNLRTRTYDIALRDKSLEANFSVEIVPAGVNGVRFHAPYLYYSNTVQNLLGRVRLNIHTGAAAGPFEIFAKGEAISQPDDFAVLRDGRVVLTRPLGDTLQVIGLDGRVEDIARGGLVSGGTSVVLAKGNKEGKRVAYVCTSGLVGGVFREGGRVVRVEF